MTPTPAKSPVIALLTDFGMRDWYVGTLKGVLLSAVPGATLVDITHDIPPQDIVAGAFTLAAAVPWFPLGTIFVAVVDPGVGSHRALLAAEADGRFFVGPDNGLLTLAFERVKHLSIVKLTQAQYWMKSVSQTFQGRDIMAPVAGHLARGIALRQLGVPVTRVERLALPAMQRRGRRLEGCIVHIDAFGNLITNLPASVLTPRTVVKLRDRKARVVSSYMEGRPRELVAVAGSLGLVELAIREGSAAWVLEAKREERVECGEA